MAIKKIKNPKKSAKYYNSNPAAKAKKAAYDTKFQSSEKQKAKKRKLAKKRYQLKKQGKNIKGKDLAHTKKGIRLKPLSANRGSKSDQAGDKRARGGKKKRYDKKRK